MSVRNDGGDAVVRCVRGRYRRPLRRRDGRGEEGAVGVVGAGGAGGAVAGGSHEYLGEIDATGSGGRHPLGKQIRQRRRCRHCDVSRGDVNHHGYPSMKMCRGCAVPDRCFSRGGRVRRGGYTCAVGVRRHRRCRFSVMEGWGNHARCRGWAGVVHV